MAKSCDYDHANSTLGQNDWHFRQNDWHLQQNDWH